MIQDTDPTGIPTSQPPNPERYKPSKKERHGGVANRYSKDARHDTEKELECRIISHSFRPIRYNR